MKCKSLILISICLLSTRWVLARTDISRFSGLAGFAMSASKSAEEAGTLRNEGPLGFAFSIDHSWRGPYFLFAEHMRSMSGASTAVGLTGAGIKYYPWVSPLHFKARNADKIESVSLFFSGYSFYMGGSFGFAQSSILSSGDKLASLAAGLYVNAKAGVDYPMSQIWGLRGEFNYAMTIVGSGAIQHLNLFGGVFFDL